MMYNSFGGSMKKIYALCVIFFIVIIILINRKDHLEYIIKSKDNTFLVYEKYNKKSKSDYSNYYIEVSINDSRFNFEITKKLKSKIIKDIYYFKNSDYECILPLFSDNTFKMDLLCLHDKIEYHYSDLKNKSLELDKFASSYEIDRSNDLVKESDNLKIYDYKNDDYIVLSNYNGISIINNNEIKNIKLFESDIYKKNIETILNNYYIVANYNENHDFSSFIIVDIISKKVSYIKFNFSISFDSYIQGIISNKIYLFDKDAKKQYVIDLSDRKVSIAGNTKSGIVFYDDFKIKNINAYDAYNYILKFNMYTLKDTAYKIDKVGNLNSGYKYFYNDFLYSSLIINDKIKTYVTTLDNMTNIKYYNNYLYYIKDDILYLYDPLYGIKKIVSNTEWKFNNTLDYFVYKK